MLGSILRKMESDRKLNILVLFCHERADFNLCQTGHNFFALKGEEGVRPTWDQSRSITPKNYSFVSRNILSYVDMDVIICGNPSHLNILVPIAKHLNLPIINIYHTCAPQGWNSKNFNSAFSVCHRHVFITPHNQIEWSDGEGIVIDHPVDIENFKPLEKENYSLTVCNDFINRKECGADLWNYVTQNTPRKVIGETPGLSSQAGSFEKLTREFGKASIYINTSLRSPIPMSLTESASSECAILTTNTCSIPDWFKHEETALIFSPSRPQDGIEYLHALLNDEKLRIKLGSAAREKMKEYTMKRYIRSWNEVLYGI